MAASDGIARPWRVALADGPPQTRLSFPPRPTRGASEAVGSNLYNTLSFNCSVVFITGSALPPPQFFTCTVAPAFIVAEMPAPPAVVLALGAYVCVLALAVGLGLGLGATPPAAVRAPALSSSPSVPPSSSSSPSNSPSPRRMLPPPPAGSRDSSCGAGQYLETSGINRCHWCPSNSYAEAGAGFSFRDGAFNSPGYCEPCTCCPLNTATVLQALDFNSVCSDCGGMSPGIRVDENPNPPPNVGATNVSQCLPCPLGSSMWRTYKPCASCLALPLRACTLCDWGHYGILGIPGPTCEQCPPDAKYTNRMGATSITECHA